MPQLKFQTYINAPIQVVFDLARSIDLHKISTEHTNEEAIAGKTSGLIDLGESVTWHAKHFGITQTLTSKITEMEAPYHFTDEMVDGAFKSFRHEHIFEEKNGQTLMTDHFDYTAPYGILGVIANGLFLKRYMISLLSKRNQVIKEFAESGEWRQVLPQSEKKEIITMNKDSYMNDLLACLDKNRETIKSKLQLAIQSIPEKTKAMHIGIFASQDGEGMFSIYINPEGPDLYVLQKALGDKADIYDPGFKDYGDELGVPYIERDEVDFDVNHTLALTVAIWLNEIWVEIEKPQGLIPFHVFAVEGSFSLIDSIQL